jgi:hypothetical protein
MKMQPSDHTMTIHFTYVRVELPVLRYALSCLTRMETMGREIETRQGIHIYISICR